VEYDGNVLEDDFYFGTVSNTLSAAGMFRFRKNEVRFNDGKFEVVLIRKVKTPFQIFSLLKKMRRHEYDGETLVHFQASKLRFTFEKPESWTLDGECSGPVDDVRIDVKNNAVRIFCPDSEYFL
jgi:diacylglycerol kinase family enzyme